MMNKTKLKIIIILILFVSIFSTTLCAFAVSVEKVGTISVKGLSTVLLDNTAFLDKVQSLDSSITTIDKNTDLNRATTISDTYLNDANIVSTSNSSVPTYLWVDNGTIYYYTVATTIDLNDN